MKDKSLYVLLSVLPLELVHKVDSFIPKNPKKKEASPSMQKQLIKIQRMVLKGKNSMYMRNLEDFCLD
jgi:hypothetical protein